MPNCYIGLDQGSTSTKALALSSDGQILFETKRHLGPPFRDGLRVEQDPLMILNSVREVLDETVRSVASAGFSVKGAGLSCQRSSCLGWEKLSGKPVSPVLNWRDSRGKEYIDSLKGKEQFISDATGLPLTPYYSASKLRWLWMHAEKTRAGIVFGPLSSFLAQRLTESKQALIDHTQAARTQLMNIQSLAWDAELISLFGLGGIELPAITPTVHHFGDIAHSAGTTPLLICIGDQQAAMTGLGVSEKGDGGINYGTGGFLVAHTGEALVRVPRLMSSIHYSEKNNCRYLLEGSVNAAGDALEWMCANLKLFSDYTEVDDLCWQARTDVVAFIGLNGTGSPHWEDNIGSAFQGMTAESTRADLVRGGVEGIAFFIADIAREIKAQGLDPTGYTISGGLSGLSYLVQVQADILAKELRISTAQEVSALGAALLAGMADKAWTTTEMKKIASQGEVISPRQNAGAQKRYRRWKELHRVSKILDGLQ